MGNGPWGQDMTDDSAPTHGAATPGPVDLDLRTRPKIAEAERAAAILGRTPLPPPRHAHGSVSVDNMYDMLDRLHCASDITNLLAAAEAARWYAADQYCMSGSSTWKTQHRCLERLCDEATT